MSVTIQEIRERLDFNPETGKMIWAANCFGVTVGSQAGSLKNNGYREIKINGANYPAHRVAWAMHYGSWPTGEIDHINHNRDDNRISNLRVVTHFENCRNRRINKNNTAGHLGVYQIKHSGKWTAHIQVSGKKKHLGTFSRLGDAVKARKAAEKHYGYHSNHGQP